MKQDLCSSHGIHLIWPVRLEYFKSELFRNLETRRAEIKAYANERYSWDKVAAITTKVYSRLSDSNNETVSFDSHHCI